MISWSHFCNYSLLNLFFTWTNQIRHLLATITESGVIDRCLQTPDIPPDVPSDGHRRRAFLALEKTKTKPFCLNPIVLRYILFEQIVLNDWSGKQLPCCQVYVPRLHSLAIFRKIALNEITGTAITLKKYLLFWIFWIIGLFLIILYILCFHYICWDSDIEFNLFVSATNIGCILN